MKKLLGILGTSLIILGGLVIFGYVRDELPLGQENRQQQESVALDIVPPVMPHSYLEAGEDITKEYAENSGETAEEVIIEEDNELEIPQIPEEETAQTDALLHSGFEYAYSMLGEQGKNLYDIIYNAIVEYKNNVILPTLDAEAVDLAFKCVTNDHPEIFYITGYKYIKSTKGGEIRRLAFSANYSYSREERDRLKGELEIAANELISGIAPETGDYEKIKYIYDIIVKNTDYDLNSRDNQNIISVLLNHSSVCQGYAKTLQLLLNKLNVDTTLVVGTVTGGDGHAWNIVNCNGAYYYLDCTWGDAFYEFTGEEAVDKSTVNYDYLCVPLQDISETHYVDMPYKLPQCNSIEDNYYVREGLYFADFDTLRLQEIFNRSYGEGKKSVTIKMSDDYMYSTLETELLTNKRIFDFLGGHQDIRYGQNPSTRTITFWL